MRLAFISLAAFTLLPACGGAGPTPEEEALPETERAPELTANSAAASGTGNPSTTSPPGAEVPGGPVSDRESGAEDTSGSR